MNHTAKRMTLIASEELATLTDVAGIVGYFPQATVKRWKESGRAIVTLKLIVDETATQSPTEPENATTWLTVTEAARLHLTDVDGISDGTAKGKVSRACDNADIATNGKRKRHRLIDPISFAAWRLAQREKDLAR